MKAELSTTIIRSGPRLFKNVLRRPRIEKRPGRNTLGYFTRAINIGEFARRAAFRNCDAGNPRCHLDALFENVLKRLATARSNAARELFGFRGQGDRQKILRENASATPPSDIPAPGRGNNNPQLKRLTFRGTPGHSGAIGCFYNFAVLIRWISVSAPLQPSRQRFR
jgi:hypothetical protein